MDERRMLVQLSVEELEALVQRAVARALEAEREPKPDHYTAREVAEALRCSDRQVRRLIATGRLPLAKLGDGGSSRVLVPRRAVEALLKQSTH